MAVSDKAALPVAMSNLQPHPEAERIADAVVRLRRPLRSTGGPTYVDGTYFRAVHPRFADFANLASGIGSLVEGSRWNAPGAARILHAATEPELAIAEALAVRRRYGLPLPSALPLTLRAIRVRLSVVLDLRDGAVRRSMRVSADRLRETDWRADNERGVESLTQAIGRAAGAAGFEGMFVDSVAQAGGTNLVVFIDHLRSSSRVEPADADDLA